jgi:hypothetical protein
MRTSNGHRNGFGLTHNSKPADFDRTMLAPFIRVPLKLFQVLTPQSVLLLSWLMNFENLLSLRYPIDGTFYVDRSRLLDELQMDTSRQSSTLRKLEAKSLVRYKLDRRLDRWIISIRYRRIVSEIQQFAEP